MSRRSRIAGFGSAGLLVVLGIACAVIFSGTLGQNLAFVLVALGLVLATSLVFYEVGLTEDRARAREETDRRREEARRREAELAKRAPHPTEGQRAPHPTEGRERSRLSRMRGRPRRLR
jgi:hypothetical protein